MENTGKTPAQRVAFDREKPPERGENGPRTGFPVAFDPGNPAEKSKRVFQKVFQSVFQTTML